MDVLKLLAQLEKSGAQMIFELDKPKDKALRPKGGT